MNYLKLTTENRHVLYVKSMSKLHRITHLAFNEVGHTILFKNKDKIAVSTLPGFPEIQLMADLYSGSNKYDLENLSSNSLPFADMYMYTYGGYFQIAGFFDSVTSANAFLLQRPDTAPLDSTTFKKGDVQLHFICAMKKSRIITK